MNRATRATERPRRRGKLSRRGRRLRSARRTALLVGIILAGGLTLVWADAAGVFGRRRQDDWPRYHQKTLGVTEVVDGDTFDVDLPDGSWPDTRIRLWGVDTPEVHRKGARRPDHFGPEASARAKELLAGQSVRLELLAHRTRGKYGRLLAYVWLPDGTMLNARLVQEGFAYADPRFAHPRKADFARLAREAKAARRGLWADVQPHQLPDYLRK